MRIVLILPGQQAQYTLNELGDFLAHSKVDSAELECWRLPDAAYNEPLLESLMAQYRRAPADILLFPSGWQGAELATRLAYRLEGGAWREVCEANFSDGLIRKKACGGALLATLRLNNKPWCLSVVAAPGATLWQPDADDLLLPIAGTKPDWLVARETLADEAPDALASAKRVLAVGRGVGSEQNMVLVEKYAEASGMDIGASREAVMHAWCGMDKLIGMSGQQVAAEVCVVAGVSGAPAFISGIARSQFIVAINNDPQAAIFRYADVGIVDELLPVLAELSHCVKADT